MSLEEYRSKRKFNRTTEPRGKAGRKKKDRLIYVVQKHQARQLHYDFRLEMDGVLKSWAVPKNVPLKKGERRLAMRVEDHPLDYADFEGLIPEGSYGAGSVLLWDQGTYRVLDAEPGRALRDGKIRVELSGRKLRGEWILINMKRGQKDSKEAWLLIKGGQDSKPLSSKQSERSVASGRTLKQIATDRSRAWESSFRH